MLPVIHYTASGPFTYESPCGDSDDQAIVTEDPNKVTCEECMAEIGRGP